ncbi:dynein beta chain, ciliary [Trichonephila clavipes]|nr:dynein beta chain, ciliary [Trichonephila clavipes]
MLSSSESLTKSEDLLQLWLHESQRVYGDKLLDQDDLEKFDKILADVLKRNTVEQNSTNLHRVTCYKTDELAGCVGGTETTRNPTGMQGLKCRRYELWCKEAEKKNRNTLMGQKIFH